MNLQPYLYKLHMTVTLKKLGLGFTCYIHMYGRGMVDFYWRT